VKKADFACLVMGVIGGLLFALGMCMCLLPEWDAFREGIVLGTAGAAVLLALVLVRRKLSGKAPLRLSGRTVGAVLLALLGLLTLGTGLCLVMVWEQLFWGILMGLLGILLLLCLIPLCVGLK